jgi:hypothetical protein
MLNIYFHGYVKSLVMRTATRASFEQRLKNPVTNQVTTGRDSAGPGVTHSDGEIL